MNSCRECIHRPFCPISSAVCAMFISRKRCREVVTCGECEYIADGVCTHPAGLRRECRPDEFCARGSAKAKEQRG
jgi:hypothetical protein